MVGGSTLRNVSVAAFGGEFIALIYDMRWMLLFSLMLIAADFWFGSRESLMKGTEWRFSKAGRKTLNKLMDYLCYLMVGGLLGKAIAEPYGIDPIVVASGVLALACIFEVESIAGHICELHGIHARFSLRRLFILLIAKKSRDVADAIDETIKDGEVKDDKG